jgi:biofilm PGA synthesis protein PgaD
MNHPYVIKRPDLQSRAQRHGSTWVTFGFWLLYLYLWSPLITLLAWALQLRIAHFEMVEQQGYLAIVASLQAFTLAVLLIFVASIGWAQYNYRRFRYAARRDAASAVTSAQLASHFEVPQGVVEDWQRAKTLTIYLDEQGRVMPSAQVIGRMRLLELVPPTKTEAR